MSHQYGSLKVATDPICGIIDIRPVLPMIETEEFQALAEKRQLGMTYLVFRSAHHTRLAHCLGAYHATRRLADRWVRLRIISEEEGGALAAYALYHDIGHPAFSHVTEDFCGMDDDQMSLVRIRKLRSAIEAAGVNFPIMERIASHEDPLYLAVHDKNLGMEKLDYLERDGFYTILSRPAGVEYLRNYVYFVNGEMAIDEKVVEYAIDTQNFYMKMYKNVYLRKALVIAQRMFHKMVFRLVVAGELKPEMLSDLTDPELLGIMYSSSERTVQAYYYLLRKRELFREAIVVRPRTFIHETRLVNKPIAVFGVEQDEISRLVNSPKFQKKNHVGLETLENAIAAEAGIPSGMVLAVPVFNPERFSPKDVAIYGSDGALHSLEERRPAHFREMQETARSYFALRVCTLAQYREILSAPQMAERIFRLITDYVA
jgi:HD superfamily phosphohydrolase